MNIQVDGLGKIQAENTHNGLSIDNVPAGYQIEIIIKLSNIIYKGFYFVDGILRNVYCFHIYVTSLWISYLLNPY